jgi:hypothetical protein
MDKFCKFLMEGFYHFSFHQNWIPSKWYQILKNNVITINYNKILNWH